jgi:hypothetical protein
MRGRLTLCRCAVHAWIALERFLNTEAVLRCAARRRLIAGLLFAAHVRPVVQNRLGNEPQLLRVLKFGIVARKAACRAFGSRQ